MSDNIFHRHLDQCQQCRDQPFNLCPSGYLLLNQAVQETAPKMTLEDFINTQTRPDR